MKNDFNIVIQRHQDMWNWIADEIEKDKIVYPSDYDAEREFDDFADYKMQYLQSHGYRGIHYNCFLCDFLIRKYHFSCTDRRCLYCPVQWPSACRYFCCEDENSSGDHQGLYSRFWHCTNYQDAAILARQIANLPVKEEYLKGELK